MTNPPFYEYNELCQSLQLAIRNGVSSISRTSKDAHQQGQRLFDDRCYLPGEPRILMDREKIAHQLRNELVTEDLDRLRPYLWLVATQSSAHISSLTHQIVRGRRIVLTENPGLHLLWHYDRVFIKPLPKYLLSYNFWKFYLFSSDSPIQETDQRTLRAAALGHLRSYKYLITHRSDFNLAMEDSHRLLPEGTKYSAFSRLIESLEIDDSMVSPRYQFGELRLSRLNFWVKIFHLRFTYHKAEGQYGPYFARFYGPILFLFGVFSVLLSSMQVVLATVPLIETLPSSWDDFTLMSRGFSVFTLIAVAMVIAFLVAAFIALSTREIAFAVRDLYRKRKKRRVSQPHPNVE